MEGSMMRGIIAFAFTALATSAGAADIYYVRPAPPGPLFSWTGCYIGGNVGWAQVSAHFNDRIDGNDGNLSSSAFAGGGQIGCDYQFAANWVLGIQGLIDWTDIKRSRVSVIDPSFTLHREGSWFATATARLGYLFTPTFLFYVKGGWGFVNDEFSVATTVTNITVAAVNRNASGGDVGVGFEWMFTPNWTFSVEWDHIFLDHNSIELTRIGVPTRFDNISRDFDKVLFGVNWRFGGRGLGGTPYY
jgi:outer membrane immunogenic protein